MQRFKNILFYADCREGLGTALDRAVALSRSNGARLTVMDVAPEAGLAGYVKRTYDLDLNAQLREQSLASLEETVRPYTGAGVPVYTTVVTGIPFIEVIRAVQRNGHDLLMKVAQQDACPTPWQLGSNDMHLLRKCPCPVWIDRASGAPAYGRLLAAVDPFDDASGRLQRLILDLATSLGAREQADVEVVHAWELPGESTLANGRGRIPADELALLLAEREELHREALDELLLPYGLDSGADGVHLRKGRPAQVISACAAEREVDLIVMGSVGRVGIPGLIIGNTAEDILRSTRTAVLAVKPDGFVSPVQ